MKKELLQLSRMLIKLAEVSTDKGILISDDYLEVGREVFIEDENGELVAAPDGEYLAEDGKVFVVAEGKVTEIREPETPAQEIEQPADELLEETEPETPAEPEPDERDAEIARLQAQIEELNNIIAEKDEEIGKLKAELEKSDEIPAEEKLKSQKPETTKWFSYNR